MNTITEQEIIELAIEYGVFIDTDDSICGDGMDVVAFAHAIISRIITQ